MLNRPMLPGSAKLLGPEHAGISLVNLFFAKQHGDRARNSGGRQALAP